MSESEFALKLDGESSYAIDLLSELVGEELPFEFIRKRHYDFLVVQKGFRDSAGTFFQNQLESILKPSPRPMIVQVKREGELNESAQVLLMGIRDFLQAHKKGFRIYPSTIQGVDVFGKSVCNTLKDALEDLGVVQPGTINSEIVEVFCNSTRTSMEIQAQTNVTFLRPEKRVWGKIEPLFSGSIEIAGGGIKAMAIITTNLDVLKGVTQRMVGDLSQVNESDIRNVACELINIVAGHAKAGLNDLGYQVNLSSLPSLFTPEFQPMLAMDDDSAGIVVRMNSDLGPMALELRFFT
jgi:CheY-specific phosphatase CheX